MISLRIALALALVAPLVAEDMELVGARMRIPATARLLGSAAAPLTLVEFTDFQCPYCRKFHTDVFPALRSKYINLGRMRFTAIDFPLNFHANALSAAQAVRCAGDQNKYWEMRDLLAANHDKLDRPNLGLFASRLRLDSKTFAACLDSNRHEQAVRKEYVGAARSGIRGTPSFLLGRTTPEGLDGVLIPGSLSLEEFEKLIQKFSAPR
jgi:protein-disulfide isomerase